MSTCAVYRLDDDRYLVRGTSEVAKATELLLSDEDVEDEGYAEDCDLEPIVEVARSGLFRFNPCGPNNCCEGHSWHLGYALRPGRGVFPGVLFERVAWVEVEYASDIEALTVKNDEVPKALAS